jgi:hypothetical protein
VGRRCECDLASRSFQLRCALVGQTEDRFRLDAIQAGTYPGNFPAEAFGIDFKLYGGHLLSDNPNTKEIPSVCTIALHDIRAEEELTCDYHTFDVAWREKLGRLEGAEPAVECGPSLDSPQSYGHSSGFASV